MRDQDYLDQLDWAKRQGLHFNEAVERKQVDGVFGMYAKQDLGSGVILASYPVANKLDPDQLGYAYPKDFDPVNKQLHSATREYMKGRDSKYYGLLLQLETLDELREVSSYFYTAHEKELIHKLNPLLFKTMNEVNSLTHDQLDALKRFDADLDLDAAQCVCLNWRSRAWGDSGFMPVLDLFNHSDQLGQTKQCRDGRFLVETKVPYRAGEQIWISYGAKDMYWHALDYNYFDPTGRHFIDYAARIVQIARTPFEKEVIRFTTARHKVSGYEKNGQVHYKLEESGAFFGDDGPTDKLIEYVKNNCFLTPAELSRGYSDLKSFVIRMAGILNTLQDLNHVDQFPIDTLPKKLHRFHQLLVKEQQMLKANKKWLTDHFPV